MTYESWFENSIINIKRQFETKKEKFIYCVLSAFLLGLAAHLYGFMHSGFAHDALNAFIATSAEKAWKIELGRFFVPAYTAFIRGPVTLPWIVGILGILYTAVAVFLVTEIFDIKSKGITLLTAGIMVTNITYIAQIATYMHEFDCNALALLLSVFTVYLWFKHKGLWSLIAGGICLMLSIGIYQAYIDVAISLIIWKSVMNLFERDDVRAVFKKGIKGIVIILLGCILYWISGKFIYTFTGINLSSRTDIFALDGKNPVVLYLGLIKPSLKFVIKSIIHPAYNNGLFYALAVVLTVIFCVLAVVIFIKRKYSIDRILLILALVGALPFGMNLVYFLARGSVHDLMIYAFWLFYFFMLLFADRITEESDIPVQVSKILKTSVCVMLVMFIWQNILLANTAYLRRDLGAQSTMSIMTRVADHIESRDDYIPGQTEVAFIGIPINSYIPYRFDGIKHITGTGTSNAIYTDTSIYFYNNYKVYLNYIMQRPTAFCSDEVHARFKTDQRVRDMPVFPNNGYIEMIDGVLVIKMG